MKWMVLMLFLFVVGCRSQDIFEEVDTSSDNKKIEIIASVSNIFETLEEIIEESEMIVEAEGRTRLFEILKKGKIMNKTVTC